jgi:hypothetical protein
MESHSLILNVSEVGRYVALFTVLQSDERSKAMFEWLRIEEFGSCGGAPPSALCSRHIIAWWLMLCLLRQGVKYVRFVHTILQSLIMLLESIFIRK